MRILRKKFLMYFTFELIELAFELTKHTLEMLCVFANAIIVDRTQEDLDAFMGVLAIFLWH